MSANAVNRISVEEQRGYDNYQQHLREVSRVSGVPVAPAPLEVWLDREHFTRDFSEGRALAGGLASDPLGRRRGAQDESTIARMDKLISEWVRANQVGVQPATIVNLSPLQLQGSGPLTSDIVIPPCPPGQMSVRRVIPAPTSVTDMKYSWRDERDDNWSPVLWYPIQLARDFEEQYYSKGGVVIYSGDFDPLESPKVMEAIKEAEKRMILYAKEQWRDAMHQWNSPNRTGARNINVLHRAYAQILLDRRVFTDVPPWFDATPETKGQGSPCPGCGNHPPKAAYKCPTCAYIIDPRAAYENMEIDEANTALARLTRDVLEELGVSGYVTETFEERKERIKNRGIAPPSHSMYADPLVVVEPEGDSEDDETIQQEGEGHMTKAQRKAFRKAAAEAAKKQ